MPLPTSRSTADKNGGERVLQTKNKTKQSKAEQNKTKQSKTKQAKQKEQNKTKQNKAKQSKAKQSKAKQSKEKQSKTKQNKTKQNKSRSGIHLGLISGCIISVCRQNLTSLQGRCRASRLLPRRCCPRAGGVQLSWVVGPAQSVTSSPGAHAASSRTRRYGAADVS